MKKIAIMQPYFFPYLGYISLIKNTDQFILLDTVQFIRHGWIERNRIIKQTGGWMYFKVPLVKHHQTAPINSIKINNDIDWKDTIIAQLRQYKKIAPYYNEVNNLVENLFKDSYNTIIELNRASLVAVCSYLGIKANISVFSESGIQIKEVESPDDWALNISKSIDGVTEYWNPPGGKEIFDINKYNEAGIKLRFLKVALRPYKQGKFSFEPGLSIIDVMMFNSPEDINKMLDEYDLE